jgi:hypothetical protein
MKKESSKSSIDIASFANSIVFTPEGEKVRLGLLWQKRKTVFVFLRHFACIACRAHAKQVWADREKYESAGGQLIFIGNGRPSFIEHFKRDLSIEKAVVLTDPTLEAYRAAGFRKGFFALVQPRSALNIAKLASQGHSQAPSNPDSGTHWQLGGIVAVNPQGKVLYHYVSQALGDFPEEPHFEVIQSDERKSQAV